ncbi:MAG: hypothetical protein A2Z34_10760 [Planctomycetes bacterium RBG_16_59_8]|nr:MAG: hypothetical protein A2Z34_10760 [Planctomycetes bacterium RBG_16_59_8]
MKMQMQKKSSMVPIVFGAVVVIGAVVFFMMGGGPSKEQAMVRASDLSTEAEKFIKAGKYDKAIGKYKEAIDLLTNFVEDSAVKRERTGYLRLKEETETLKRLNEEGTAKYTEMKTRIDKTEMTEQNINELERNWDDAKKLAADYATTTMKKKFDDLVANAHEYLKQAKKSPIETRSSETRSQIQGLLKANKYGEAIEVAKKFISDNPGTVEANKMDEDARKVNRAAVSEFNSDKSKAESQSRESKERALEFLAGVKEKYKGTEAEPELEKLIGEIERQ